MKKEIRNCFIWYANKVAETVQYTSIGGEGIVYDGSNVDNDIRFGCIAYGINIKE